MHAKIGQNHLDFAQRINDTHDSISTTFKNTERSRKQVGIIRAYLKKN